MDYILDNVGEWKDRLVNNSVKSFTEMTPQRWIRIIVIVGAYMLIRPYLLKAAANRQKKQLEKEAEELGLESSGEPDANALRGAKSKAAGDQPKPGTRQRKTQEKKT
ncbi:hypothetical protein N0V83_005873 [Neocucurbitaria cava]|uniref:Uncharacterized protein n=1 Tax=Neocucurbitaria cava TaxID=798079 RepID=A0A9W9CLJ4_9PLEO|nr:hypothetical protein N0V83_005873 [Neocucurbitaria cava]